MVEKSLNYSRLFPERSRNFQESRGVTRIFYGTPEYRSF
jgi:hypothetical protein